MDFIFQSNGQNSSAKAFYDHDNYRDTLKSDNNQFYGSSNVGYSFYRNTQNVQSTISANAYGNYSKTKSSSNNYKQDYSYLNNDLSVNYDLKYFITPANWFVTAAPDYILRYYKYKNREADNKSKNLTTEANLKIGGGKGRIEQVQDFRHAILLIDELNKRGVSKRNISEAEMIELSILISQLKNKRFFDARKQKEAELIALDSFFVDKGIVDEKSIQYFTGLEDIWTFGGLQVRESGKQVLFSITPGYSFDKNFEDEENNINENIMMRYNLSFVSKKPISVKWQRNYGFGIDHMYQKRLQQRNENYGEKGYFTQATVDGQIGYYPNTRTYFDLSSTVGLSNSGGENIFDKEQYSAGLRIATSGYYYISEKLRLGYSIKYESGKTGIFNNEVENTYFKRLDYYINLNYAIF